MDHLIPMFERAAGPERGVTFVGSATTDPSGRERVSWEELLNDARAMAAALSARGIGPGSHVSLLGTTTRELVTAIEAVWVAGATAIILPLPMRLGSIEEFVGQTRVRVRNADSDCLVADPALAEFLEPKEGDPPVVLLNDLAREAGQLGSGAYERPPIDPEDLAILQFTSGSTADPKGVMLPHRCVAANQRAIARAVEVDLDTDRTVSWLPLYHDMGLIGTLGVPMSTGIDLVLAAPQDFLAAPADWMRWMSDYRGTFTAGPNFAYALAARALRRLDGLDLSSWRLALNGAEPIDPDAVERFLEAGAPHRLSTGSAFCAFGMAEATLAVTFPRLGGGMTVDEVDRRVLETDHYAAPAADGTTNTRRLPRLGTPLEGLEIRIADPDTGAEMGEREVGELELRGTSVTPGYYRRPDVTAEAFHDGWLRTGDLAYMVDGELVACGRIKDVIIVGGRNVYPEDIERAVETVEGVRAGNVVAFGTDGRRGREALVVVAETKADNVRTIAEDVAARVTDSVGIPPEEVVMVSPGSLPKTSSGKLQRSLCRDRYHNAALQLA